METKKQIVIMHGGHVVPKPEDVILRLQNKKVTIDDFKLKKDWKDNLNEVFGKNFDLLYPRMPNKENAKYSEWKVWFEKLVPFLTDDVIFIGHSLGGLFFVKYLVENKLPKKIRALFLVAAPHDGRNQKQIFGTFVLGEDLNNVTKQVEKIYLYHSKEDPVVPFSDFEKYQKKLPSAQVRVFEGRGHFNGADFPELVADIKSLFD